MDENFYAEFEPGIHDYGDNYHRPDDEVYAEMDEEIRNIKRKYRHYSDWLNAVSIVTDYMEKLIDKYGGVEKFQIARSLNKVTEHVPFYPRFKETKQNKYLYKNGIILSSHNKGLMSDDIEYIDDPDIIEREKQARLGNRPLQVGVVHNSGFNKSLKSIKGSLFEHNVKHELDLLEQFYTTQISTLKKSSKKSMAKALLERRKQLKQGRGTLAERFEAYNEEVVFGDNTPDPSSVMVVYKNTTLTLAQVNELKVRELLKRAGFDMKKNKSLHSKKVAKMIKRDEKKEKKKKKKGKKEKGLDRFVGDISGGEHKNFDDYENAMRSLLGSAINKY